MGVSPEELVINNGRFVGIVDFTGNLYEGVLHYKPITDPQFPIQIWSNNCCFVTYIDPDDVEVFYPDPSTPCLIKQPCCATCLPYSMLLDIISANMFCTCLINEAYVLEWNSVAKKYEFNYPGVCDCTTFHAELQCSAGKWIVYLALMNEMGFTCVDGNNLDFPIDCVTMKGTGNLEFTQTGTCACGPCANSTLTLSFSPLIL
jgi:hypothetical protein